MNNVETEKQNAALREALWALHQKANNQWANPCRLGDKLDDWEDEFRDIWNELQALKGGE